MDHPGDAWGPILAAAAAEAGATALQYVGPAEAGGDTVPTACLAGAVGAVLWAAAADPALAGELGAWLQGCAAALGVADAAEAQVLPPPPDAVGLAFQTDAGAPATLWMAPGVLTAPEPAVPAFPQLGGGAAPSGGAGIDLLLEVPMVLTVELGRAERQIRDVLGLAPGSIVELDRLAGEPVDLLVNGHLIAHAEVVVVDENFGVRITDVVSPSERISRMQGRT